MPKNQDGEYELLLGNHQLLGVFFIVIILLGVFFAMGYLVGRNSAPTVSAEATTHRQESKPVVVDTPAPHSPEPAPDAAPQQPLSTQPQTSTEPTDADTPRTSSVSKPEPTSGGQPAPGTYLQLSATQKAEAEVYVDELRKKNFPAVLAEVPDKQGTFRVLVGPLADADVNKTRTDLENASLPGKDAIKRTY